MLNKKENELPFKGRDRVLEYDFFNEEFPRYMFLNYDLRVIRLDYKTISFLISKLTSKEKLVLIISDFKDRNLFKFVVEFRDYFKAAFDSNEFNAVSAISYDEFETFFYSNRQKISRLANGKIINDMSPSEAVSLCKFPFNMK
jgi:hypothetical protein